MRPLYSVVAATTLVGTGITIVKIALPAQLAISGHSAMDVGLVSAALTAGWPIFGLIAGLLLDRFDRASTLLAGIFCALLPTLWLIGTITTVGIGIVTLCALAFTIASGEVLTETSGQTLLPQIVDKPALQSANSLHHGSLAVSVTLVAPIGATALLDFSTVYSLAAAAAVMIAATLVSVRSTRKCAHQSEPAPIYQRIFCGLSLLAGDPTHRVLSLFLLGMTICWGGWTVLIVVYIVSPSELAMPARSLGIVMASVGIGSLCGASLYAILRKVLGTWLVLASDLAGTFAFLAVPAIGLGFYAIVLSCWFAGIGGVLWMITVSAFQQANVPDRRLGRVVTTYRWFRWSGFCVGSLAAGPLASAMGVRPAMAVFAAAAFALMVLYPLVPGLSDEIDDSLHTGRRQPLA